MSLAQAPGEVALARKTVALAPSLTVHCADVDGSTRTT